MSIKTKSKNFVAMLAGIRAYETTFITFPKPQSFSGVDESRRTVWHTVHLPLRGQRWLTILQVQSSLQLPV
jgi:hypothetical protein